MLDMISVFLLNVKYKFSELYVETKYLVKLYLLLKYMKKQGTYNSFMCR